MKKNYLQLFVILCLTITTANLTAQQETIVGTFMSIPVGDFGSTELENGGFANNGWGVVFDSKARGESWPKNFSAFFQLTYQWNKMNTQAVSDAYTQYLGYQTTVSDSKYSPIVLTAGPAYDIPIGNFFSIGLYTGAGVIFNNTKAFTVSVFDNEGSLLLTELVNFENSPAFAYLVGVSFNISIIKDYFSIGISADYTSANQKTELTFTSTDPANSFEKLQFINPGLKLIFFKKN